MTKEELFDFINANQTCFLAIAADNQPKVRGMMMYSADENGIIFHTGDFKCVYKDMLANPKVEICFLSDDKSTQIRIQGEAAELDDDELKKEIIEKRPFLKPWVETRGLEMMKLIKIKPLKYAEWTQETNLEPTTYEKI